MVYVLFVWLLLGYAGSVIGTRLWTKLEVFEDLDWILQLFVFPLAGPVHLVISLMFYILQGEFK